MSATFGSEMAGEMLMRVSRIRIAQAFPGWTLEYIDSLDEMDLVDIYAVLDADRKLQNQARVKAQHGG